MASWEKFKNRITKEEIQVRPIYNQKELGERKQTGIGFKINGKEVIINELQTKELICYLVSVS